MANGAVDELSGIAASRRNPGVWWVHNDSGNPAAVYAVGDNGADLGTFTLTGATNVDWEDIAVGPGPAAGTNYLYVADIGNNIDPKRNAVVVYRAPSPTVVGRLRPGRWTRRSRSSRLTYPGDATPDAESLLVDPVNGDLFVVTKECSRSRRCSAAGEPRGQLDDRDGAGRDGRGSGLPRRSSPRPT